MKMEERDRQIREEGMKEGIEKGIEKGIQKGVSRGKKDMLLSLIQKKLEKGKTVEEIADALEEEVTVVEELIGGLHVIQSK